jgi:hypothetical protein
LFNKRGRFMDSAWGGGLYFSTDTKKYTSAVYRTDKNLYQCHRRAVPSKTIFYKRGLK